MVVEFLSIRSRWLIRKLHIRFWREGWNALRAVSHAGYRLLLFRFWCKFIGHSNVLLVTECNMVAAVTMVVNSMQHYPLILAINETAINEKKRRKENSTTMVIGNFRRETKQTRSRCIWYRSFKFLQWSVASERLSCKLHDTIGKSGKAKNRKWQITVKYVHRGNE